MASVTSDIISQKTKNAQSNSNTHEDDHKDVDIDPEVSNQYINHLSGKRNGSIMMIQRRFSSLLFAVLLGRQCVSIQGFATIQPLRYPTTLQSSSYGRGAEIWPPANEEPMRLENSFPNGVLPDNVLEKINSLSTGASEEDSNQANTADKPLRRTYVPRAIGRILRRAANAQEETESEGASNMEKTPMVLAAALVFTGMIRPLDALIVSFLSGYFVILFMWARSLKRDGVTPLLPSLPPQGHVPNLVTNPLGPGLTTYSMNYDYWLKTGALLGLLAPLLMLLRYAASDQMECARACARPIFFMCCQAVSEAISRRALTPLPIRILIPLAYNTVRIGYLWHWAFLPLKLGAIGRAIAIANLTYWMANLFGFLIPVAAVRYMRAHFFAVEAEQVTTRTSMEDTAGLMF